MMIVHPGRFAPSVQAYRYLRLSYGAGSGNIGLSDLRFYVNAAAYPPAMTGNSAPSPYVASSITFVDGYDPYKAFDGSLSSEWAQSGAGAGWIKLDVGAGHGIVPSSVTMRPRPDYPAETPSGLLTLAGSNDDSTYTTLATFTPAAWSSGVTQTFSTGLSGVYV